MALSYVELLDKDGTTYRVLTDTIDEESNSHAQVFKPAFGPDTDVTTVDEDSPLPVGIYDDNGNQQVFTAPKELEPSAQPTIFTSACAQYDSLHTSPMTLPLAANQNGGTGRVLGARLVCKHDTFTGTVAVHLFNESPTTSTAGDALAVSDADKETLFGSLEFDLSAFAPLGGGRVATASRAVLPLDYECAAADDDIYALTQLVSADTPTFAAGDLELYLYIVAD